MKNTTSIVFLIVFVLCFFVTSAETKLSLDPQFAVDLSVTKTDSPDPVNTNENLTYTITVTNAGPDFAADASWSDPLPAGTTFVSLDGVAGWSCTTPNNGDNGTVSCSNPSFAVGSAVFTLVVGVAPTVPGGSVLSNTATATSSSPDGNSGNDSGTAVTTVRSPATVSGNKSHSGGSTPGSTVEYLIILSNISNSDQQDNPGDEFTDLLPAGLTLVSASASSGTATANTGTNTVTWNGIVPSSDSITISISATINSGTTGQTISNQGAVNYDADGNGTNEVANLTNNDSFMVDAASASADLGVTKVANADTVLPDSDVTYTITVANGGPDSAASVALNDTLPGTMTFVSLTSPGGWSCTTPSVGAGGLVNCTNPNLTVASGAQVFTLVGHVPSGTADQTNFTNTATVSSSTDDPNSENNSSVAGTNVVNCFTDPVVTTNADSGSGSLRAAIQNACIGSTITFDMNQVTSPIALTGGELFVNKNLTIQGPGANLLTVQRSTVIGTAVFRVFNVVGSTVTIAGLRITNGSALNGANGGNNPGQNGGGISNTGTLTITRSVISGNRAGSGGSTGGSLGGIGGDGGGIFSSGALTIVSSTISDNRAGAGGFDGAGGTGGRGGGGGGIASTGTLSIINSTVAGNQGGVGGGASTSGTGGPGGNGGGILSDSSATITSCTISSNQSGAGGIGNSGAAASGQGGGLSTGVAVVNLRNSIIAGNSAPTGPDIGGTVNSQDYNLIGNTSGATITGTTTHNLINQSANLGALANNGGPTPTMLPLPGSPAINAGDPGNLPADGFDLDGDLNTTEELPLDQRGFARVVSANFDIGAVETNYAISATAGTPQSVMINTAFSTALRATVTESGNAQNAISVTFTAPGSGASGTFPGPSATAVVATDTNGEATAPTFTANGTAGGSYNVIASIGTGLPTAAFALTNTKANQTITFGTLAGKTFGDPDFQVSASATSGLGVSFAATGNCTVTSPSPGTVHITGAGSCTITASQGGDANYNPAANVPQTFSIAKANQTITFGALAGKTFGDPDFQVSASATSGFGVSFAATGNCTVTSPSPGTVHITGAGSCTITASQGGDANYNPAPNVPQTFSIAKANQTITFGALAGKTFGDPDFQVSATATSGLDVSFAATGNCTVTSPSPGTVHITGAGSCTITASQGGDANYNPAANVPQTFSIAKANQTITFGALAGKTFGDPDFQVSASATSGLGVSFAATGNCTVTSPSPGTVHITGAGSCTITASQGGDANYNPAANVPQTFSIAKANQTITFGALAGKTFGDPDFQVSASATSGLIVSFAATGNCTVTTPSPGTVHITGAGSCTITASEAGNANYNPATPIPQTFNIAKAGTSTAVSSSVNPSDLNQNVAFTATVTAIVGPATGTVQFKDGGANIGSPQTLNGSGVATFSISSLTSGTHAITVDYSGDPNFTASTGTLSGGQVVKAVPSLSINDVSLTEGNAGTTTMDFTVTLSAASNLTVNVNFATANGTANAGSDYQSTNGTLTFNPGDLTKTVGVTINGDLNFETNETFVVNLSTAVNATIADNQGAGTIQNDDAQGGFISFSQATYSVSEGAGFVTITLNRSNDVSGAATVDYATNDAGAPASCNTVNGLASSRCDFTTALGTIAFAAGESTKSFTVLVNRDAYLEGPELFNLTLSNLTGGAVLVAPSAATVEITDGPGGPPANLIDDAAFFVLQHYHDFLNREPDAAGLAFWTNQITSCGSDAQCIEVKRVHVSASFFLSIEFQETGGTAYLTNKAAFAAIPTYSRFERDSQALSRGYIFGTPGAAAILEANKVAYFNGFVNNPEFVAIYGGLSNGQYVDTLIVNLGVGFTAAERDALVNGLNGATETRATVLRKISENPDFRQAEVNRMFVAMEYFGYLRRDPDTPGFNFWVNKLNTFNGDYIKAEMVKAFMQSIEYRQRFGP